MGGRQKTWLREQIQRRDRPGPVLLDGATGTELERRGLRSTLPLWSAHALVEAPQAVLQVHRAYVEAGAELLTANTFRTQARSLAGGGQGERAGELTRLAVELARQAAERAPHQVAVLGSAPPLEDCYRPERVPEEAILRREHEAHAANLVAAGVDAILAETHNTLREAVAAVDAARQAGADVMASFVCDSQGRLLSGEPLAEALEAVAPLQPLAVGVNCVEPPVVTRCLPDLAAAPQPFLAYANLGPPGADGGFPGALDTPPEAFARHAGAGRRRGRPWSGGCCGTTAEFIRALARAFSTHRVDPTL